MHGIELRTLVIVVSFLALLLAGILAAMRSSSRHVADGMGQWAAAIPVCVLSSALFIDQKTHPFFHVVLANGLLLTGVLMIGRAMKHFYRLPVLRPAVLVAALSSVLAVLSWYTFIQPSFIARLTMMSFIATSMFAHLCWMPVRHGSKTMGSAITAAAFGLTAVTSLLRLLSVVFQLDLPAHMHDLGFLQAVYLWSFKVSVLVATVGFILMVNERLRDVLEFNASHDALTGILNRGAFFRSAKVAFRDSLGRGKPLSAALIDLDHFKSINDNHGHAAGDRVLQDFCRRVRKVLKPGDIFGRYGGEEFVLLLPGSREDEALSFAHRVREALQDNGAVPPYTVSIGVAATNADISHIDALLIAADAALYEAKHGGRDRAEAASAVQQ